MNNGPEAAHQFYHELSTLVGAGQAEIEERLD